MAFLAGERPFHCTLCEKAFNQKSALQVHMKKHTGERPYKCAYCVMGFTQKSNMKLHMKRAHSFAGEQLLPRVLCVPFPAAVTVAVCRPESWGNRTWLERPEAVRSVGQSRPGGGDIGHASTQRGPRPRKEAWASDGRPLLMPQPPWLTGAH